MKRITYISNFARPLSFEDIEQISETSNRNNGRDELTGALFCFRNIFYQILEGPEEKVDQCYKRIMGDDRHDNIFCLQVERDIDRRMYPDWKMNTVVLDERTDSLVRPIKNLLSALVNTHRQMETYTPGPVLAAIQQGIDPAELKPRRTERIVLFSDIVSSTSLIEGMAADDINRFLEAYYGAANAAILEHEGEILKLTGDGLMAHFDPDQAADAVRAALSLLERLKRVREAAGPDDILSQLHTGIGITSGAVLEGNIGSEHFRDYSLIGDTVNTAARLESVTRKVFKAIVFDGAIAGRLGADFNVKQVGTYKPKGKRERLKIYTVQHPVIDLPAAIRRSVTSSQ